MVDRSQKQLIELGDLLRYSCIVKPSLCGATGGGSISVWIKTQNCGHRTGIISSVKHDKQGLYLISLFFYSQFGLAAKTNALLNQWIELGDLSRYSCIVKPSLCGATGGGSLSVWINVGNCDPAGGVLTSLRTSYGEGFALINNPDRSTDMVRWVSKCFAKITNTIHF